MRSSMPGAGAATPTEDRHDVNCVRAGRPALRHCDAMNNSTHAISRRGRRLTLAALVLLGTGAALAAPPARIRDADVRSFMGEVSAASQARDVERIGALLAPDCVIVFHSGDPRDQTPSELDKPHYLTQLREGFTALHDVSDYQYATSKLKVQLTPDATQAIVDADVTESLTFNQRHIVTHSHEASVVELRDGKLQLVKVAGTVSGKSQ